MLDSIIIQVYDRLVRANGCSADRILENPELRAEYLDQTRQTLGDLPEEQLLHRLTALRKARRLTPSRALLGESVAC